MKKLAYRSKEVIIHKKTLFGAVGRWPRPLYRGGRLMEVVSLLIYNKYFWDFDNWPFNRGWPPNGGPLNRGSTVVVFKTSHASLVNYHESWFPRGACENIKILFTLLTHNTINNKLHKYKFNKKQSYMKVYSSKV